MIKIIDKFGNSFHSIDILSMGDKNEDSLKLRKYQTPFGQY